MKVTTISRVRSSSYTILFPVIAAIWVVLVLPEMKDRALEELDEMFARGVSMFRFGSFQTEGLGAEIAGVERTDAEYAESSVEVI